MSPSKPKCKLKAGDYCASLVPSGDRLNHRGGKNMKKTSIFTAALFLCGTFCFANSVKLGHISFSENGTVASFPSAEVTMDAGTKVYAISVSVDSGYIKGWGNLDTAASSYDADIETNHKTKIWFFNDGIEASVATDYVKGLSLSYEEGMTLTLDVNPNTTSIPSGVTVTQFTPPLAKKATSAGTETNEVIPNSGGTPHYYICVGDGKTGLTWGSAYDAAKTYTFLGMKGYLVTVTCSEEDKVLDNINSNFAWGGGARVIPGSTAIDPDTSSSITHGYSSKDACAWSWVCGPEAGYGIMTASTSKGSTTGTPKNTYYTKYEHWNQGEPNGAYDSTGETCFLVHVDDREWNDLSTTNAGIYYYFVEFSDYKTIDGYKQPASVALKLNQVYDTTNGQDYSSIAEAVTNAESGDELLLLVDQKATAQDTKGKALTINTEGKNLTGTFAVTGGSFTVNGNTDTVQLESAGVKGGTFTLNGGKCDAVTVDGGTFKVDGLVTIPSLTLKEGNKVTFADNASSSSEITLSSTLPTGTITSGFGASGLNIGEVINLPSGVTDWLLIKTKTGELKIKQHNSAW